MPSDSRQTHSQSQESGASTYPKAESADIALLLEGTYPFVRGGVSAWVHQIILGFPEYRFAVIFLGSEPGAYAGLRYELPPNVVHLETHYLHHAESSPITDAPARTTRPDSARAYADVQAMHDAWSEGGRCPRHLLAANAAHCIEDRLNEEGFRTSRMAWDMLTSLYRRQGGEASFLDYFWTVRSMHQPIWALARIAKGMIPARCYHSASTGYAGFLGALLAQTHGRPLVLSEHGLYTKERRIDLLQSAWIRETGREQGLEPAEGGTLRRMWMRFFEVLGQATYAVADPVISLYDGIRRQQIQDGAAADIALSIPNGIALERYLPVRASQTRPPRPVFTLIGRVVPIKDIKTFLRAMSVVRRILPAAEGWIVGPGEEDADYFEECRTLAESLQLGDGAQFLGFRNVDTVLPSTAVLVLSSISEALPLTLLEGFAAGVPAVATDVGSCRQLIFGREEDAEDRALGAAGRVVGIGDPTALAEAMLGLFGDADEWSRARSAAIQRVERYYTDHKMIDSYRGVYRKALAWRA